MIGYIEEGKLRVETRHVFCEELKAGDVLALERCTDVIVIPGSKDPSMGILSVLPNSPHASDYWDFLELPGWAVQVLDRQLVADGGLWVGGDTVKGGYLTPVQLITRLSLQDLSNIINLKELTLGNHEKIAFLASEMFSRRARPPDLKAYSPPKPEIDPKKLALTSLANAVRALQSKRYTPNLVQERWDF